MSFAATCRKTARFCAGCVGSFILWTFWLALVVAALVQVYVAATNELTVPDFVRTQLDAKLAETGLRLSFDRATFDPTGRILVQSPRVFLADVSDPVVTARAAYIDLDPLRLAIGQIEPREIRIVDGTVRVPAMFSASGQPEPIIHDIDAVILQGRTEVAIRHVTGRIGPLLVSLHGAVSVGNGSRRPAGEVAAQMRDRFRQFCRVSGAIGHWLNAFDEPAVDLQLEPSATRGAIVSADLTARGFKLEAPIVAQLGAFHARVRLPVLGHALAISTLQLQADEVNLPHSVVVRGLSATVHVRVRPDELQPEPIDAEVMAAAVVSPDGVVDRISGSIRSDVASAWQGEAVADVLGAGMGLAGEADMTNHTATVHLAGAVSPQVLDVIRTHTHVDVRKFFDFTALDCRSGVATFGPGWKFQQLTARVALRDIDAYGVKMNEGFADIRVDPQRLYAPDAYARIGDNYARGSYEQTFATHQFRFLLDGQLRPMDISEWFRGWWPKFFAKFDFPVRPPAASVDVQGVWREGRRTSVFVFADAKAPVILGQKLQRVRTRLFVRPGFYDALETFAVDPAGGVANGTFTVSSNLETGLWRTIDVAATSTIALDVGAKIATEFGSSILSPFTVAHPPAVKVQAHFDGPDLPEPRRRTMDLDVRTSGDFGFFNFRFQDVDFTLLLRGDDITVNDIAGKLAGGTLRAHAKVWGPSSGRRLGFDASVADASLGTAVVVVQNALAERNGQPHPAPGKFVQEKTNVRIDVAASAEGALGSPFSFHGDGNAALRGAEIGEVPLFGPLSALLKFSALRFTTAQATFKINGAKLEFPTVALRGANSAVDAHGEYALDRRALDFRAKVFPFQESGSVIKSVVGAVLAPISNVLEVKLTGSLENPDWAFVIGPTNFLRSLAPSQPGTSPASPGTAAATVPEGSAPQAAEAKPTETSPTTAATPPSNLTPAKP